MSSFRFLDDALQARLVGELERANVEFEVAADGSVRYVPAECFGYYPTGSVERGVEEIPRLLGRCR
ncbi:MAG: hypothetical protein R3195_00010 [Gemmatimonadota bacterium]|nr:hypothetical protein [Gemmatimonadota bacterium]